ncbi:hypothetical protein CEUSTIGMA_g10825.t1 [Chlamydomonas eustigma]|uniref:Bifunctional lysine-specific demethylase and histidyl-hydroxylase n=1 Tax=Chlamydomonas eustigma TaxID=1157962 RepID=A0A250XKS3_9CHLO|nr:hypothetical protein CEUSTIGMA_g10825.t1 [Chlamydomonas eustigma]|eukprot:GAX83400.1 hypothetical protein CEUSTIGMA_g10825.t1 [Chlamydomonas eustigma]
MVSKSLLDSIQLKDAFQKADALNRVEAWRSLILTRIRKYFHVVPEDGVYNNVQNAGESEEPGEHVSTAKRRKVVSATLHSAEEMVHGGDPEGLKSQDEAMWKVLEVVTELLYDPSGPDLGLLSKALGSEGCLILLAALKVWHRYQWHMKFGEVSKGSPDWFQQQWAQKLKNLAAFVCRVALDYPSAHHSFTRSKNRESPVALEQLLKVYQSRTPYNLNSCSELSSMTSLEVPISKSVAPDVALQHDAEVTSKVASITPMRDICFGEEWLSSNLSQDKDDTPLTASFLLQDWEKQPRHWRCPHLPQKDTGQCLMDVLLQPKMAAVKGHLVPHSCHIPMQKYDEDDPLQALHRALADGSLGKPWPLAGQDVKVVWNGESLLESGSAADNDALLQHLRDGHTLVWRALGSRWGGGCTHLQSALRDVFGFRCAGNLYVTPAGQQGLAAHYDDHCVFVLQLEGLKHWYVNPPSATHILPLSYEPRETFKPVSHCDNDPSVRKVTLHPGDLLYIPRGWPHHAVAAGRNLMKADSGKEGAPTSNAGDSLKRSRDGSLASGTDSLASVHVTFGLEVDAECTWAALIHLAAAMVCIERDVGALSKAPHEEIRSWQDVSEAPNGHPQILRRESRQDSMLVVQALLHVWIHQTSKKVNVIRKACPLLAKPSMRLALLKNFWAALHAESSEVAGCGPGPPQLSSTGSAASTPACGPRIPSSILSVDQSVDAPEGDHCCFFHACWAAMMERILKEMSFDDCLIQLAAPIGSSAERSVQDSSCGSCEDEGSADVALLLCKNWISEALHWRAWIVESSKGQSSDLKVDIDMDEEARLMLNSFAPGPAMGLALTITAVQARMRERVEMAISTMGKGSLCEDVCLSWMSVHTKRRDAAIALEKVFLMINCESWDFETS